ncbi:MAG: acyl-CoA dehydrogenase family protein, partial [Gracilibacteraceae bacterium]|nr:acyl-CoA dehydrogenase family protein [Gracilibacteraceae bacterium]
MFEIKSTIKLTEEQKLLKESFSKFVEKEVVPNERKWYYQDRAADKMLYKKMGELGYLCMWADPKYGGAGLGFLESWIVANELHRRGYGSIEPYLHSDIIAPYFRNFGSEELNDRFMPDFVKGDKILALALTEPDYGSDVGNTRASAVKDGDDYIVNGSKIFISNGIIADVFLTLVRTDPDPAAKHRGLSMLVIDSAESSGIGRKKLDKIGGHFLDLAEISFDNVRVP